MPTPTPLRSAPPAVTVAVLGPTAPPSGPLRAALGAVPVCPRGWRVIDGEAATETTPVHIAVCDSPLTAALAARRWPAAAVVALLPPRQHAAVADVPGAATVLCLPGGDIGLVAAYVRSIARRRGLVGPGTGR